ncbi:MAG: hypothetical protein DCC48_12685 [Acidobacteria bacterium]|nr:MAG: hypothetical protein DCC48_12685 [Acidobacteriota bacterium]
MQVVALTALRPWCTGGGFSIHEGAEMRGTHATSEIGWIAVAACLLAASCTDTDVRDAGRAAPDDATVTVSEGGSLTVGAVTVDIPPNAVDSDGTLAVRVVEDDTPPPEGTQPAGEVVDIDLAGADLTGSATISFSVEGGLDGTPFVAGLDEDTWSAVATRSDGDDVVATTEHLSTFGLFVLSDKQVDAWLAELSAGAWSDSTAGSAAPACDATGQLSDDGYEVTSSGGDRVQWCVGYAGGEPVLKLDNNRGYGIVVSHDRGLAPRSAPWVPPIVLANPLQWGLWWGVWTAGASPGASVFPVHGGDAADFAVSLSPGSSTTLRTMTSPATFVIDTLDSAVAAHLRVASALGVAEADDEARQEVLKALAQTDCALAALQPGGLLARYPSPLSMDWLSAATDWAFACTGEAVTEVYGEGLGSLVTESVLNSASRGAETMATDPFFAELASGTLGYEVSVTKSGPAVGYDTRISLRGFGPIEAGMTVREAEEAANVTFTIEDFDTFEGYCYYATIDGLEGINFMVGNAGGVSSDPKAGIIGSVVTWESGWSTLSGIQVGDSEVKVLDTYGDQIYLQPHVYDLFGWYFWYEPLDAEDREYAVKFEISGEGRVTGIHAGLRDYVAAIEGCA